MLKNVLRLLEYTVAGMALGYAPAQTPCVARLVKSSPSNFKPDSVYQHKGVSSGMSRSLWRVGAHCPVTVAVGLFHRSTAAGIDIALRQSKDSTTAQNVLHPPRSGELCRVTVTLPGINWEQK